MKFWIDPIECPIRTICTKGFHILFLNHNKTSLRQGTKMVLQLKQKIYILDTFIPTTMITSKVSLIKPGQIKFKLNMDDSYWTNVIEEHINKSEQNAFKLEIEVFVDDEDANQFNADYDNPPFQIKVRNTANV